MTAALASQSATRAFRGRTTGSSSWIRRLFPKLGGFLFWLIWPYIVAKQTEKYYFKYTGKEMPKDQVARLRNDLAKITGPITKADAPKASP
jgi:hypothetical protein